MIFNLSPKLMIFSGFILLLLFPSQYVLAADYLFENTAPVAQHKRKKSRIKFPRSTSKKYNASNFESVSEEMVFGILYLPLLDDDDKIDREAMRYTAIDKCKKDKIDLDEVFHHTPGSESLDLVIYDPRYRSEIKNARKYKGVSVPWDPLYDMTLGSETVDARMQDLARVLNPECLPARFRFIYIGSKRYQEIRYGKKAWE